MTPSKTAKEYLQRLQWIDTVINQKIQEAAQLRAKSKSVGSLDCSKEKVQTSPSGKAPFADLIERVVTLEDEIDREIDMYEKEKHRIIGQIQGLGNADETAVLYKRYIHLQTFETIAADMNYSIRTVYYIHGNALKHFEYAYLQ